MTRRSFIVLTLAAMLAAMPVRASIYATPSWSLGGLASWSQPLVASGTTLPAVASATDGDLFILATTTPVLLRFQSGGWATMTISIGVGTTSTLVFPWNWGVSSATLTIKDGLITGVTTP